MTFDVSSRKIGSPVSVQYGLIERGSRLLLCADMNDTEHFVAFPVHRSDAGHFLEVVCDMCSRQEASVIPVGRALPMTVRLSHDSMFMLSRGSDCISIPLTVMLRMRDDIYAFEVGERDE